MMEIYECVDDEVEDTVPTGLWFVDAINSFLDERVAGYQNNKCKSFTLPHGQIDLAKPNFEFIESVDPISLQDLNPLNYLHLMGNCVPKKVVRQAKEHLDFNCLFDQCVLEEPEIGRKFNPCMSYSIAQVTRYHPEERPPIPDYPLPPPTGNMSSQDRLLLKEIVNTELYDLNDMEKDIIRDQQRCAAIHFHLDQRADQQRRNLADNLLHLESHKKLSSQSIASQIA